MIIENPLTDAEIEEACAKPLMDHSPLIATARTLLKRNRIMLERIATDKRYVLIEYQNLRAALGRNFDEACTEFAERYGPTPGTGRFFFGVHLPPR